MSEPLAELSDVADVVHSGTVGGIPVLFAPRPGPLTAGLMFRVGRGDETLATSGITHLVEHLAMFGRDGGEIHRNALTNDVLTHFEVAGDAPHVVSFLNHIARALRALPVERMETEKGILRTESMAHGAGHAHIQRTERYGARGPGTVPYGELGLHTIDAEQVQAWADTRFTRGNAVLWFTGDRIPDGLELDLADGERIDVPIWEEVPRPRPAYLTGAAGGVVVDAVIPRTLPGSMFSMVAQRMLFRELREHGGHSYTTSVDYDPLDADRARVTMYADALVEAYEPVVQGTIDVLLRLRAGDIEVRDLASVRATIRTGLELFPFDTSVLPAMAFDVLTRHPVTHPTALAMHADAVTTSDIVDVAERFWNDAIAQLPEGSLEWAGFEPAPRWSATAVEGHHFPVHGEPQFGLTLGEAGVSLRTPNGDVTVLFADCVGYLTTPDGARTLIGADGFRIPIEPNQYFGLGAEMVAALDERVPLGATIPMPARSDDEIPPPRGKPMHWRGYGAWAGVIGALFGLMLTFALPFTWGLTTVIADSPGDGALMPAVVVGWCLVAVLAPLTVLLFAGVRRRGLWTAATGER
jgi:predicted Zn-dependent peptidase